MNQQDISSSTFSQPRVTEEFTRPSYRRSAHYIRWRHALLSSLLVHFTAGAYICTQTELLALPVSLAGTTSRDTMPTGQPETAAANVEERQAFRTTLAPADARSGDISCRCLMPQSPVSQEQDDRIPGTWYGAHTSRVAAYYSSHLQFDHLAAQSLVQTINSIASVCHASIVESVPAFTTLWISRCCRQNTGDDFNMTEDCAIHRYTLVNQGRHSDRNKSPRLTGVTETRQSLSIPPGQQ